MARNGGHRRHDSVGGPPRISVNIVQHDLHVDNPLPISEETRERMNTAMAGIRDAALGAALGVGGVAGAFSGLAHSVGMRSVQGQAVESLSMDHDWHAGALWDMPVDGFHPLATPDVISGVGGGIELAPSITKDAEENKTMRRMTAIYRDRIATLEATVKSQDDEIKGLNMVLFRNGLGRIICVVDGAVRKLRL